EPQTAAYNMYSTFRLQGKLHLRALELSLNEIVQRHEVLRTTFVALNGRPAQVIAPRLALPLPVVDLCGLSPTRQEAMMLRLATEEAHLPFDLSRGPLLRTTLLRLNSEEHVFLLTMHHIISDGWSMSVFKREFVALYEAFSQGQH